MNPVKATPTVPQEGSVRTAIIGAGTISQSVHIPLLRRAGFTLTTVCDLSPSRVAEVAALFGLTGVTDPDEILNDPSIDAVIIATPGSHADLTARALRAGKHVLAEKPLALTIAEVEELERIHAASGRVAQVGYMKMYDPLTARARREAAGLTGNKLVRITVAHPDDRPQIDHLRMAIPPRDASMDVINAANAYEDARVAEALGDAPAPLANYYKNVLNGSVVHEFSLIRALGLELPTEWSAEIFPSLEGSAPASLLATAAARDTRYILSWNWVPDYPEYDEELSILASNGRLSYRLAKPYLLEERSVLNVQLHDGLERRSTTYTEGYETGFLRQLDAFKNSILTGAPVEAGFADVKKDIESLQRLAQAIGRGLGVELITEADRRATEEAAR
ncbi:Gfo/Idh/MocA family oxidoreductase [Lysinibacter sp. HNR]|uniref:Gfo/Idh/MocA family protein n=1 Tax=Lysinibacter sp. HNR TaxID=3031408 RepID=UPI002434C50C|nr:Gfo/Idh/MocA family oxidoreductase [Lysinibacter sp. HNR]WGD37513.1 Gfo/Idh/MocA family oxidoreductase [Lysinibacter sp. HNR]